MRALPSASVSPPEASLRFVMEVPASMSSATETERSLMEGSNSSTLVTLMVTVAVSEPEPSASVAETVRECVVVVS